ncbi:DUF4142 domain-containing protein [Polymorphobacter sp.]|uniref:DUF4142 domain-containing protein n=1 Tax=Polymorphobacter sp. TaxID=1909290 RepID=UPI003F6EB14E
MLLTSENTAPDRRVGLRALGLASAVALAACGSQGSDADRVDATDTTVATETPTMSDAMAAPDVTEASSTMQPAEYVAAAASGDMYEIQASRLAEKHSKNDGLRDFAEQMIKDHEATMAKLKPIAQEAGAPVPTAMQPRHAQMISALETASRTDDGSFDRLYREQQIIAHEEAVTLHRGMSNRTDASVALAGFARETLPKVEQHLAMLQAMPADAAQ